MRTNLNTNARSQRIVSWHLTSCSWRIMGVTHTIILNAGWRQSRLVGSARNNKNQGMYDELINECPHGPDNPETEQRVSSI